MSPKHQLDSVLTLQKTIENCKLCKTPRPCSTLQDPATHAKRCCFCHAIANLVGLLIHLLSQFQWFLSQSAQSVNGGETSQDESGARNLLRWEGGPTLTRSSPLTSLNWFCSFPSIQAAVSILWLNIFLRQRHSRIQRNSARARCKASSQRPGTREITKLQKKTKASACELVTVTSHLTSWLSRYPFISERILIQSLRCQLEWA